MPEVKTRKVLFHVQNSVGGKVKVSLNVREGRSVNQYFGPAIIRAQLMIPNTGPWGVVAWEEN